MILSTLILSFGHQNMGKALCSKYINDALNPFFFLLTCCGANKSQLPKSVRQIPNICCNGSLFVDDDKLNLCRTFLSSGNYPCFMWTCANICRAFLPIYNSASRKQLLPFLPVSKEEYTL